MQKLVLLNKDSVGIEARIFEYIIHILKRHSKYKDTWCELFKSTGFKRNAEHVLVMQRQLFRLYRKAYPGIKHIELKFLGSKLVEDLSKKEKLIFLLIIDIKEK